MIVVDTSAAYLHAQKSSTLEAIPADTSIKTKSMSRLIENQHTVWPKQDSTAAHSSSTRSLQNSF
ncbi:hypothetical protein DPMN_053071 [Dreissena polymorpha]|uniref:Uncharacterized protein n=1 Tax=Dreissena polymorpha TaxID=45954 RepID=A0A9D4CMX0_DREPO|nr:hypothetical protein DPMN_053071 [Dreissena polymorpha]